MFDRSVIQALQNIVGEKNVLTHKVDLVTYSFDATPTYRADPDVVVKPGSTEEIRSIVTWPAPAASPSTRGAREPI